MDKDTQHKLQLIEADLTNGAFSDAADEAIRFLLRAVADLDTRICDTELDLEDACARVEELEYELEELEGNAA